MNANYIQKQAIETLFEKKKEMSLLIKKYETRFQYLNKNVIKNDY